MIPAEWLELSESAKRATIEKLTMLAADLAASITTHEHDWLPLSRMGAFRILDCACGARRRQRLGMNELESVEVNPGGSASNCLNIPEDLDFTRNPTVLS